MSLPFEVPELLECGSSECGWYALQVKAGREKSVAILLRNKGFPEFLPLYASYRRWSDRMQQVDLPLFPGYVFSSFDPNRRLPILITPGVIHVVGMGGTPTPVDPGEIGALEKLPSSRLTPRRSGMAN